MKVLSKVYNFLIFVFLYAPIAVMIVFSFNSTKSRTHFGGFSLHWYEELFRDPEILSSLYLSLTIAALSAIIATLVGTLAAVGIHSMRGMKRRTYLAVNNIPVTNPDIVTAISMMILFVFFVTRMHGTEMGFWTQLILHITFTIPYGVLSVFFVTRMHGMEMGFGTLLISHITFNIPYVVLSVLPKLRGLNENIFEAAQDLGCPPAKSFLKVVVPQISQGIVTGFIMAFTLSLDDFVISYFNSGSSAQTLPVTIYAMTKRRVSPKINALSTLLFVAVMALLLIVNFRRSGDNKKEAKQ